MMNSRILVLVVLAGVTSSQDLRAQALADTGGVHIGLRLNGSTWTVDFENADAETGIGLAMLLGYGISDFFTVYGDLTLASTDASTTYGLSHLDVGIRLVFAGPLSTFRPYADLALSGRSARWEDPTAGRVRGRGLGGTLGGGFLYFLSPPVAFDLGFKATFGGLTEVQVGGTSYEVDVRAKSARINVGFTLFLNR